MELCEHDNEHNSTSADNGISDNVGSVIPLKIIAALTYLLGTTGNFLYLGIMHYEKFGQDAQKRSFPDRIFSFNCYETMVSILSLKTLLKHLMNYIKNTELKS